MSTLTLCLETLSVAAWNPTTFFLPLPATDAELEQARQKLGIADFAEANIRSVNYNLPYLNAMIPQKCICVEKANELARSIEEMQKNDGELLKYFSVLEVEQPNTFTKAYRLVMNLDDYEHVPNDRDEYGREVLRRIGADDELLATIDGFTDFAELGAFYMKEDGVVQTEFGIVRKLSEPFDAQGYGEMRME